MTDNVDMIKEEDLLSGKFLRCAVCEEICQRGVSMPCCASVACRGCAVKKIAVKRGCWVEGCQKTGITSEDLVNDEDLREAVKYFRENGTMTSEQAKKRITKKISLMKKYSVRKKPKSKNPIANEIILPHFKLLISNFPIGTTADELKECLGKYGTVNDVEIKNENATSTFVTATTVDCANNILHQDIVFKDMKLRVEFKGNTDEYVLLVDELEEGTTQEDLENLLLKYGEVKEIKNFDKKTGDESSKILVIMTSPLGTRRIMDDVKNLTINAKKVLVKLASQQPGIKPREETMKPNLAVAKTDDIAKILLIKGPFKKEEEEELVKLLEKYGRISDSKLNPSRIGAEGKNKGKTIPGSGVITFAKPGSVKTLADMGEILFRGNTMKMRRKGQQPIQPKGGAEDANILVIKGDFKKQQEEDLLQMLAKFGKITGSNLNPSRISEGEKNKGKKIVGSGSITFAKPGSVKTLAAKGQLEFKGQTIKMKQKGGSFPVQTEGVKKDQRTMMPMKRGYNVVGAWHGGRPNHRQQQEMWSSRELQMRMSGPGYFQGGFGGLPRGGYMGGGGGMFSGGYDTMEYARSLGGGGYSRAGGPPSKMTRRY